MRIFIAINFNDNTKKELLLLQEELQSRCVSGRFTAYDNLHLTLVFLGECDERQTDSVIAVINDIKFEPFSISVDRVGRFKRDGGDLWWAGVQGNASLTKLDNDLTEGLKSVGFKLEKRKFSPHITLGRKIITDAKPWSIAPFGETVKSIELMKSEHINGVLRYSVVTSLNRNGITQ